MEEDKSYDKSIVSCTRVIVQLINLLKIPDDLLASLYDSQDDSYDVDDTYDNLDIDSVLSDELSETLIDLMKQFRDTTQDDVSSLSSDSRRIVIMFRNLLTLFMRIIATKNDELSILRNQYSHPYEGLVVEDKSLQGALQRIHDLMQANEEQSRFYHSLVAALVRRNDTSYSVPSTHSLIPEDETDSISLQNDEIHHLRMSLQTAQEDVDMLQKANELKDQQITALKLELRTVNCYVKDMGELKQQNASREAQQAARIRELKGELQKKEFELNEMREQRNQPEIPPFSSFSAPLSNDSIQMYQSVIEQLNREVLSLQRSQSELTAQLNASQRMSVSSIGEVCEEDWSCVEQMKAVIETLQRSIHEKNAIIEHQNEQLQLVINERDDLRKICEEWHEKTHSSERHSQELSTQHLERLMKARSELEEKVNSLQHTLFSTQQQNLRLSTVVHTELNSLRSELQAIRSNLSTQQSSILSWLSTEVESLLNHYTILDDHHYEYRHQIALLRDEIQNYKGNYRVMIRTRPILPIDDCTQSSVNVSNEYQIKLTNTKNITKSFTFDRVFSSTASQEDVCMEVEPVIMSIFRGINACILAYGQTGSGKTFTMIGEKDRPGIILRSVHIIFEEISYRSDPGYCVKLSICELYGETVRDLLQNAIEVNVAGYGGNHLSEVEVDSEDSIRLRLIEAMKIRSTAETKMNERSSRSHLLVTFILYHDSEKLAKLTLVDLAGSENLKRSEVQNERKKEAQNINLSLFELTNVLRDLTIPNKVVVYRNSKLTMMLKDCLSGESKNLVLIHVSPTQRDYSSSLNSLQLAEKITHIEVGNLHSIPTTTPKRCKSV